MPCFWKKPWTNSITHLSIQYCKGLDIRDAGALAQARAAVTASTALRELHCPWLFLQLPAERQLLQLTALTCSCSSDNAKQLVRCCPAVKQLDLVTWLQLDLLLPLTGLTYLSFPELKDDADTAAAAADAAAGAVAHQSRYQ